MAPKKKVPNVKQLSLLPDDVKDEVLAPVWAALEKQKEKDAEDYINHIDAYHEIREILENNLQEELVKRGIDYKAYGFSLNVKLKDIALLPKKKPTGAAGYIRAFNNLKNKPKRKYKEKKQAFIVEEKDDGVVVRKLKTKSKKKATTKK